MFDRRSAYVGAGIALAVASVATLLFGILEVPVADGAIGMALGATYFLIMGRPQ